MYVSLGHYSPPLPLITALRKSFPTPQPDIHCKAKCLQTLSVMCYVVAIFLGLVSFWKRKTNRAYHFQRQIYNFIL